MKKLLLSFIVISTMLIVLLTFFASAETISSGKCGENLTYTLDDAGTLVISGTGDMHNFNAKTYNTFFEIIYYSSTAPWQEYRSTIKKVMILNGVTSIGNWAFAFCDNITSVTIPSSLIHIGSASFRGCEKITRLIFPNGMKKIGGDAFLDCTSLAVIKIPDSVISMGDAFDNTAFLNNTDNWESNVLYIGNHLIKADASLSGEYIVKDGTKTIAGGAFLGCTKITGITMSDSVEGIGSHAFFNCSKLETVRLSENITDIGGQTFANCTSLTSITIPNSVIDIDYNAFEYCTNLKTVTISGGVEKIGEYAFSECTNLTSIFLPESVIKIDKGAFENCTNLLSIKIPDSVTSIAENVFYNTAYYNNWTYEEALYVEKHLIEVPVFLEGQYKVKEGTKTIADKAFYYCSALTDIELPESIENIGDYAFGYCSEITNIKVPAGVKRIGDYAFEGCEVLEKITFEKNSQLTTLGNDILKDCTSVSIDFGDNSELKEITSQTFSENTALKSINFGENSQIQVIGERAFCDCTKLTSVIFGKGSQQSIVVGVWAFGNCVALKTVVLPDGVTDIGDYAFCDCESLESISIPTSVTRIGLSLFLKCKNLKSVTIPVGVTRIDIGAFENCENLTDVYYAGSKEEWNNISFDILNYDLTNADIHFNCGFVPEITYGDISGDGSVDVSDVITTLQLLASGDFSSVTENGKTAADVNGDGNIDVSDVIRILQYLASPGTSLNPNV